MENHDLAAPVLVRGERVIAEVARIRLVTRENGTTFLRWTMLGSDWSTSFRSVELGANHIDARELADAQTRMFSDIDSAIVNELNRAMRLAL